jgi:ornithine cyclodeaminase
MSALLPTFGLRDRFGRHGGRRLQGDLGGLDRMVSSRVIAPQSMENQLFDIRFKLVWRSRDTFMGPPVPSMPSAISFVPFVSVDDMMKIIHAKGVEIFLVELTRYIEDDFRRWDRFQKTPRLASHSVEGVIEIMPTCDGAEFSFKYVNGHPKNTKIGRQTVAAFGALADVTTGYPLLLTEMTFLTALRTAATSALAAKHLAPQGAQTMALIGNGAQADFQALAFRGVLGIDRLRVFDIDPAATSKLLRNLAPFGFDIRACGSAGEAVEDADVITTITADKQLATILNDNMVGKGQHINAVGGDCPGKTEVHVDVLRRSDIFVEFAPQTRIEGDVQQLPPDHPVTELWEVIGGTMPGRHAADQLTLFDSVGFAIEDFSAMRMIRDLLQDTPHFSRLDLMADPDDPRDLFGMLMRHAG